MATTPSKPTAIHYVVAAFNLSQDRALLYSRASNITSVNHLVKKALDAGATIISIRRIHPIPTGTQLDITPTTPPDRDESEKGP